MRFLPATVALGLAMLIIGCAETAPRPPAAKPPLQNLQFSYPTAQRNVVALTPAEREFMLNEMRYYLDMLWVTSDALSHDDFTTVVRVAQGRASTMKATPLPPTLEPKLPAEYLALSRAQHAAVDELAVTAEKSRDSRETLHKLGLVLQRCNDCHAIYQYQTR